MANRYPVADGFFQSTSVWSASSGGTPGASAPGSSDAVILDGTAWNISVESVTTVGSISAVNYSGTLTLNSNLTSNGAADFTGMTGTLAGAGQFAAGSDVTLSPDITISMTGIFRINGGTFTTNGKQISSGQLRFATGTIVLADNVVSTYNSGTGAITLASGTLDAATHNVDITAASYNFNTGTLDMGSGTWTANYNNIATIWVMASIVTVNASTSKIVIDSIGNVGFSGGGKTYYDFENATTGAGKVAIIGANTFNNFTGDAGSHTTFPAGVTNTAAAFAFNGTSGSPCTVASDSAGSAATLSQASGTAAPTDTTITDIAATGGATFSASLDDGNVNGGGNSGWLFPVPGKHPRTIIY